MVTNRIIYRFGVHISPKSSLGEDVEFRHPNGVIIGDGVVIGDRVVIYQQVTLGGARLGDGKSGRYPKIGEDSIIFAGAKIIGPVAIGRGCIVGANAVVNRDVPDYHTAVGVPARHYPNKSPPNKDTSPSRPIK